MSFKLRIKFIFIFVIVFLAVRVPHYIQKMQGEDGIFAALILKQPENKKYTMMMRVNGKEIYDANVHPAFNYEAYKFIGKLFFVERYWKNLSPFWVTTLTRVLTSFYMLLIFLLALHLGKEFVTNKIYLLAIGGLVFSPVSLAASTYLQIDNTAGVLFIGVASYILLALRHQVLKISLAGLLIGFGKHEWVFAFLASLAIYFLYSKFKRLKVDVPIIMTGVFCLLGCFISFLYLKESYMAGFQFVKSEAVDVSHGAFLFKDFFIQNIKKLFWAFPIILLQLLLIGLYLKNKIKLQSQEMVLLIYSFLLVLGYMHPKGLPHSRYFAPALVVILFMTVSVFKNNFQITQLTVFKNTVKLGAMITALSFITISGFKLRQIITYNLVDASHWTKIDTTQCIPKLDGIEFVGSNDFIFAGSNSQSAQRDLLRLGLSNVICSD